MTQDEIDLAPTLQTRATRYTVPHDTRTLIAVADANRVALSVAAPAAQWGNNSNGLVVGAVVGGTLIEVMTLTAGNGWATISIKTHGQLLYSAWYAYQANSADNYLSVIEVRQPTVQRNL